MNLRARDIIPISEARARLAELAKDVLGSGANTGLAKIDPVTVTLGGAQKLDGYRALEL